LITFHDDAIWVSALVGAARSHVNGVRVVRVVNVGQMPAAVAESWEWQLRGACRGLDSGMFFHPEYERGNAKARREERAKSVCRRCPVLTECRTHALEAREPYGIWGAMTEQERSVELANRQRRLVARSAVSWLD
jgi:WhiB family redox-sensing transcriptional regulator